MATKPKQTQQDLLQDGRHLLAKARKHLSAFKAADKDKKIKLLDEGKLKAFDLLLKAAKKAIGTTQVQKTVVGGATRVEVQNRKQLFDELVDIREDIKLAHPEDKALAKAFLSGFRLSPNVTSSLLEAAGGVVEAYDTAGLKEKASDAGVTKERIHAITSLSEALAAADTTQNTQMAEKRAAAVDKASLLRKVRAESTRIRKVAARVFRKQPNVLMEFKSTVARRAPKKRPPKDPPKKPPANAGTGTVK